MDITFTVQQALKTKGLLKGRVLAGKQGLGRRVSKITVAELPDTLYWLQGGEIVCTTGFYLKNNPEEQCNWIIGMSNRNIAALVIKPERFFGTVPEIMIELAERYNLPLIALPYEVTWPTVIEGVMSEMLDIQTKRLKQSYDIHNQLTKLVLESKGIKTIVETISQLLQNPVIFEDRFFNLIAHSAPADKFTDILNFRLSKDTRNLMKLNPFFTEMLAKKNKEFITETININGQEIKQLITPVFAGNTFFGWLTTLIIDNQDELTHRIALEHGSTVLALELLNEKTRVEAQSQAKMGFLNYLLENDHLSNEELQQRANLLGLGIDLNIPTCILYLRIKPKLTIYSFNKIQSFILSKDPQASVMKNEKGLILFFHPKNFIHQNKAMQEASSVANSLIVLLENEGYSAYAGIGRCYKEPREIKTSYLEAVQAATKAARVGAKTINYYELGLERLFSLFPDSNVLKNYANDLLKDLIEYDKKNKLNLVETLNVYLLNNHNQAQTARQLHIHINTLAYRLQRIKDILQTNIDDPETCMMLYFALRFHQQNIVNAE